MNSMLASVVIFNCTLAGPVCMPSCRVSTPFSLIRRTFRVLSFPLSSLHALATKPLVPFSFQQVTTIKFCNPFILITIQNAGGDIPLMSSLNKHLKSRVNKNLNLRAIASL